MQTAAQGAGADLHIDLSGEGRNGFQGREIGDAGQDYFVGKGGEEALGKRPPTSPGL
jgi:hypothetical protein